MNLANLRCNLTCLVYCELKPLLQISMCVPSLRRRGVHSEMAEAASESV